ncbi:Uncharacterised protein [Mycobacteroides abscessus subsp. abscessus]|nr:Uncharacterised protein [Mycobacteroides abscessus subsp. abscessus]
MTPRAISSPTQLKEPPDGARARSPSAATIAASAQLPSCRAGSIAFRRSEFTTEALAAADPARNA